MRATMLPAVTPAARSETMHIRLRANAATGAAVRPMASSLRGEVIKIEDGVLHLKDNDNKLCYVAIDKIVAVWDARDEDHRAGFVSTVLNTK